jgi:5-dehydro-4-deoxyglucarate dehydratase
MVARLADKVPTLDIWKDGQGNARVYQRIMAKLGDRLAWVGGLGDDCLPTYLACGVQAFTSSISNTSPKLALELAEAGGLTTGKPADFSRITPLMNRFVHPIYAVREHVKGYEVSVMKYAMDLTGGGITGGPVRPPLENVRPEHKATVEAIVADYQSAGY